MLDNHDPSIVVDAVALNLHGIYGVIERLFEIIARQIDRSLPTGDSWHRDLLNQMVTPVPGLRPALLSTGLRAGLDSFRRFRHVVRNVSVVDLDPDLIRPLVQDLRPVVEQVLTELSAFAVLLEEAAEPG